MITDSSGYYIGGVYVGIVAMLAASRGFSMQLRSHLVLYFVLIIMSIVVAIVGTAIQAGAYNFVSSLEACSSYSSTLSTSCSAVAAYYTCTGNSDYYTYAEACEITYVIDNGTEDNQCSCVTNDDTNTCYSYTNINDCNKLLTSLPKALQTSYAFDVICLLLSVFLLIVACLSFWAPSMIESGEEKDARNTPLIATNSTPATVVTTSPIVVVQGTVANPIAANTVPTATAQPAKANNMV